MFSVPEGDPYIGEIQGAEFAAVPVVSVSSTSDIARSRQPPAFHYVAFSQPRGGNSQSRDRAVEYSITSPKNYGSTQPAIGNLIVALYSDPSRMHHRYMSSVIVLAGALL
jgi:hypothetical protein